MANNILHSQLRLPIRGAAFNVLIDFDNPDDAAESFDTEISKDNGAFADCTNELEVIGGAGAVDKGFISLTAAEMTAYLITLKLNAVSGLQPSTVDFEVLNPGVLYSGLAVAGSTTTLTLAVGNRPDFDIALMGCYVRVNGEAREIRSYNGSTGQATFDAMVTAVAGGHAYDILLVEQSALDYWRNILTGSAVEQIGTLLNTNLPDVLSLANIGSTVDAQLAAAGVNVTTMGRLDVAVSTRLATAGYSAPPSAADIRAALGMDSANLDTQLTALGSLIVTVDSVVDAIKVRTDGLPMSVDGKTLQQWYEIVGAVAAGNLSGAGTGTEVITGLDGLTVRITATVQVSGNRTVVFS